MRPLSALILFALLGTPAASAHAAEDSETCPASPMILSLANKIIDGREDFNRREDLSRLSRLKSSRFGTVSAYLLIHYGNLDKAASTALLDKAVKDRLSGAEEVHRAYRMAGGDLRPGDLRTFQSSDPLRFTIMRPLILADHGVRFFEWKKETGTEPDARKFAYREDTVNSFAARALFDVPDETRAKVAAIAVRMGEIATALTLLADQSDLTAFHQLVARHPNHRLLKDVKWFPESLGVSIREQSEPVDTGNPYGLEGWKWRHRFFEMKRVNYRFGPIGFLNFFYNKTGKELIISDVAAGVNDAIEDGWLDPAKRPEQALTSLYRQLVERMGHKAVDEGLKFGLPFGSRIKGKKLARDTIHEAIASQTLRRYIAGERDTLPVRPNLLPSETLVDWQAWTRVAGILREGHADTLTEEGDVRIGIELAFAAADIETAVVLAEQVLEGPALLQAFKDLMIRLDWQCAGHTWSPGTGYAGGLVFYRFPMRS